MDNTYEKEHDHYWEFCKKDDLKSGWLDRYTQELKEMNKGLVKKVKSFRNKYN
tara:strand:+ start:11290 stop:11448 length:159 start_codon:yes stop_codon:yes gene_type:complete